MDEKGHGGTPDLLCTFCARPQHEVRRLIGGPHGLFICEACVELAETVISSGNASGTRLGLMHVVPRPDREAHCSFCGKGRDQVTGLAAMTVTASGDVSWPATICNECLSLCNEINADEPDD